jgi:hypothetical protein
MPAKAWKPVRLTANTLAKLAAVKAALERAHERGQRVIPFGPKGEIPNDYVIGLLADQYLNHLVRSKRKCSDTPASPLPAQVTTL